MPELSSRVPCPVCLGVTMHKVTVGEERTVEVDLCGRCGGIWLEQGEVQALRANPYRDARIPFDLLNPPPRRPPATILVVGVHGQEAWSTPGQGRLANRTTPYSMPNTNSEPKIVLLCFASHSGR